MEVLSRLELNSSPGLMSVKRGADLLLGRVVSTDSPSI
jgi:hypothetical protein